MWDDSMFSQSSWTTGTSIVAAVQKLTAAQKRDAYAVEEAQGTAECVKIVKHLVLSEHAECTERVAVCLDQTG